MTTAREAMRTWDAVETAKRIRDRDVSREEVLERQERGPTFPERLARALAAATPELLAPPPGEMPDAEEARLAKVTDQVVHEAVQDHAVLVGRAAVAVVGRREGALHVKLVAAVPHRVAVVAGRLGIPLEEAEKRVRDVDAHRTRYHRQYYDRDWTDPRQYHLVLNTGWLGLSRTAEIVVTAIRPDPGSFGK